MIAAAVLCLPVTAGGCRRDVRLAGRKIPHVKVAPVRHYGITFDAEATPEETAYAVLRAIREDVLANDPQQRDEALKIQFDLCAAGAITAANRTGLDRDEFIYHVVYRWAPTVGHYAEQLPPDLPSALQVFERVDDPAPDEGQARAAGSFPTCRIRMEVHDPDDGPNAGAVLVVWLAREEGLWRVVHLGFEPGVRTLRAARS